MRMLISAVKVLNLIKTSVFLSICFIPSVQSATLSEGIDAYTQKNYKKAFNILNALTFSGDSKSAFYLSLLYKEGQGVSKDDVFAVKLLTLSAKAGFPLAQFNLGNRYLRGDGMKKSPMDTVFWWKKAADKNMIQAQYNLGSLYLSGNGILKNERKARVWYERAAKNGSQQAQNKLVFLDTAIIEKLVPPPTAVVKVKADIEVEKQVKKKESIQRTDDLDLKKKPLLIAKVTTPPLLAQKNHNGQQWVRDQPPNSFTIQLLAGSSISNMKKLIKKYQLKHPFSIYQFQGQKGILYGIGYGHFDDVADAKAAVKTLPESLRKNKPWVRKFAKIQKLLIADSEK